VRFVHPTRPGLSPRQGQVLFYLGSNPRDFAAHFGSWGLLMAGCDQQQEAW
jgi:hypothetical protein